MNKFLFLIGLLFFLSCKKEQVQGSSTLKGDERNVTNFTSVSINAASKVTITKGSGYKVEVKGYSNLLPFFVTEVVDNNLALYFKDGADLSNNNIEVFVTMPQLTGLRSTGAGHMDVKGDFVSNQLDASISGSGNISIESGTVDNFVQTVSGSGHLYAFGVTANKATIIISGSSISEVSVANQLKVKISGSSSVFYKGNPTIESTISGNGKLVKKD